MTVMGITLIVLASVIALPVLGVAVWTVLGRFEPIKSWRMAKVRIIEFGSAPDFPYYVRYTPDLGFGLPWVKGRRLRIAPHHGVQIVQRSTSGRWCVKKQLLFKSKVKGERFMGLDEKVKARLHKAVDTL